MNIRLTSFNYTRPHVVLQEVFATLFMKTHPLSYSLG